MKRTQTKKTVWHVSWRFELVALSVALACAGFVSAVHIDTRGVLLQDVLKTPSLSISRPKPQLLPVTSRSERAKSRLLRRVFLGGRSSSKASLHAAPGLDQSIQAPIQGVQRATSDANFPPFEHTTFPVSKVPNWGAMHGAAQWGRSYMQMAAADFVNVPSYDTTKLMEPFQEAVSNNDEEEITLKLFYSTKFFGAYDLDAGEYTWIHPGVDLKLAIGTPIGAIAGGRVYAVRNDSILGLHVIVEHHHPTEGVLYSIYGHMGSTAVKEGDAVVPGQLLGTVGMTGNTSAPHVHLQIDRKRGPDPHMPFRPDAVPSPAEADRWTVHPIHFIEKYAL